MSEPQWNLLNHLHNHTELTPGLMTAIAVRLEDALGAASRQSLKALTFQLQTLYDKVLYATPTAAKQAATRTADSESAEAAAYALGQLGFAQLMASQALNHRADDDFIEIMSNPQYKKYIECLYRQETSNTDLAELCDECTETVSRKLAKLRNLGICDFRKIGNRVFNFLTPVARVVAEEKQLTGTVVTSAAAIPSSLDRKFEKQKMIDQTKQSLPPSLQFPQRFSPKMAA